VTLTAVGLLMSVSRYAHIERRVPEAPVRGAVRVAPARGSR
jgi:hypothetical protein